ncbi:MAG: hypothetical protein GF330_05375 [Candidatus Eisenbacteria bacterium]|nr:hypothetical protein [Candidatus Eisenbacteria bacterium]
MVDPKQRRAAAAPPPKNELAALGLVNRHPMHGYALRQAIEHMGLEEWANLPTSSIYSALRRLARQGAASVTREREGQAPERNVYHITPAGRERLADHLRHALSQVGAEDRLFYLGLAFADGLPVGEILSQLERRVARLREVVTEMKSHQRKMRKSQPGHPHVLLMSLGGMKHMQVELEICRRLVDLFRSEPDYFERFEGVSHGKPGDEASGQ